ncbi:bifunctional ADP-dependent NAD(P)H-hydrate dehydratase/NAD(P)H-hydrate epimerase [Haloechinothrix halophila]|uniref:Bifunctional NAD(P)H-hydrate repair enzyme n=1 Tax=Haloechinothrix halophila YIM 93223 TaxID=592678 RepID=W9DRQ6_9PSEU|nr:bifunctional ADP-dependent NAD(P)H-hydrate dehydratase/NAD(P)H-hydrate epimerase [Haloechinothrix halophila]ETA66352.1 yjeF-like protein, hydroxyethylthiazole kinase-related [Haloechinothrix halophila YIM 93223]
MREVWTTGRIRAAEDVVLARTQPGALMRRAAFAVSVHAARMLRERSGRVAGCRVALLVGAGNNGGDALWAGAFLRRRGVGVTAVLLAPDKTHTEGLAALRRAGGRVVTAADVSSERSDGDSNALATADLVIDGIVGLAARGGLRPDAAALVERVTAPIIAVDLPSGVDPDTGAVTGPAVAAAATVTFGAYKPLHVLAPAASRCGEVHLIDIGLRPELGEPDFRVLDPGDVAARLPLPKPADDKYTQGVVGVAAGGSTYPGAAVLTTSGAVLTKSGMVRYAGSAADVVRARWPEVIATGSLSDAGRVQAWVTGPGLGTASGARETVREVLAADVPVIADADAVNLLAAHPDLWDAREPGTPLVLTPHEREFARLAGDIGDDHVAAVVAAAKRCDAVVLLKGHSTVIADQDGRVLVHYTGRAWPATAGSGDVLSGIIGALLAAGVEPLFAAGCAAWLHDSAAAIAASGAPTPASLIAEAIPAAIRALEPKT